MNKKLEELNKVASELQEVMKPLRAQLSYQRQIVKKRRMINRMEAELSLNPNNEMLRAMIRIKKIALLCLLESKQECETVSFQEKMGVKL